MLNKFLWRRNLTNNMACVWLMSFRIFGYALAQSKIKKKCAGKVEIDDFEKKKREKHEQIDDDQSRKVQMARSS